MMKGEKLRLGFIGCGAVTELFHLPGVVQSEQVEITALVEKDVERARKLAARYGAKKVSGSHLDVLDQVDAVVVALPNALHAAPTIDCLERGIHVLVEKPMAPTTADCDAMISAAGRSGAVLGVGMVRRFFPAAQWIRTALREGLLGNLEQVDVREGAVYRWPAASLGPFRRESAGGGVLIDTGVHLLDLLLWWFGTPEVLEYRDDAEGGVEADCELRLGFPGGFEAFCDFSRTRDLRNTIVFTGSRGTLELKTDYEGQVRLRYGSSELTLEGNALPGAPEADRPILGWPVMRAFRAQIEDFADAIRHGRPPAATAAEGREAVRLIEHCYANRQAYQHAWETQLHLAGK